MNDFLTFNYSPAFFERLCPVLREHIPTFDSRHFIFRIFNNDWPEMPSAEREIHLARVLHDFLPIDFGQAAGVLRGIARGLGKMGRDGETAPCGFLFKYIELFGTEHMAESMSCLSHITRIARQTRDSRRVEQGSRV